MTAPWSAPSAEASPQVRCPLDRALRFELTDRRNRASLGSRLGFVWPAHRGERFFGERAIWRLTKKGGAQDYAQGNSLVLN